MENMLKAVFATVGRVVASWSNWNRRKEWERLIIDMNVVFSLVLNCSSCSRAFIYLCLSQNTF